MRRIAEAIICYLVAAHIVCWTATQFIGRMIEEVVK